MVRITPVLLSLLVLFVASCLGGAKPSEVKRPDVRDLLMRVTEKYSSMKTYASEGEVVFSMTTLNGTSKQDAKLNFSIRLRKPNLFLIQWEQSKPGSEAQRLAMWGNIEKERIMVTSLYGGKPVEEDRYRSFAMMNALSGGAATTIPSMFFDTPGQPPMSKWIIDPVYEEDEAVAGDECYVVSGWYGPLKRVYWISKKTLRTRQHQQVFGDGSQAPEFTDERIAALLDASDQPVTPESIAEIRDAFQSIKEDRSDVKGTITETHTKITVNAEMSDDQLELDSEK